MVRFEIETVIPYTRRVAADEYSATYIDDIIVNEAAALLANGHIIRRWPPMATPDIIAQAHSRAEEILELRYAGGFE